MFLDLCFSCTLLSVLWQDLTEIEITKAGHRKKLLSEITKLGPSNKLPTHKPVNMHFSVVTSYPLHVVFMKLFLIVISVQLHQPILV